MPEHIVRTFESIEPNVVPLQREPWQRAPIHMVDTDAFCIDVERQSALTQSASHTRTRERDRVIGEMRSLCPDIWGIRGKARFVQQRWLKKEEELVPLRTIQHYFRITRS